MKLEWAGRMLLTVLLVAGFAGCSPDGGGCEDPPFAAGSSLPIATDCAHRVATSTAVYDVSCLEIPERALAEGVVEVTDNDEQRFIHFGVEGRKIKGLAVEEIFALNFEQGICGKLGWYSAFGQDMSDATEAELERRFGATFSSSATESDCATVSPAYQELFDNGSITTAPVDGDVYLKASAVVETWYLIAEVDGSAAVWVTDDDPQGDKVGHIISGNDAAQRVSNFDFVDGPMSMSTLVQAAGNPDRVEDAESCIPR